MVELALNFSLWCIWWRGGRCGCRCRSPCVWRDQTKIWTLVQTSSSSSSPGRGWRSWCRPKFLSPEWTECCARPFCWFDHQGLPQWILVSPFSHHIVGMCEESLDEPPRSLELTPLWHRTLSLSVSNLCNPLPQWHWHRIPEWILYRHCPSGSITLSMSFLWTRLEWKCPLRTLTPQSFPRWLGPFCSDRYRSYLHHHFRMHPRRCVDALRTSLWLIS